MPTIAYQFVSTGGREIVDTFRSIEGAARGAATAMRDVDRAGKLRAPRAAGGGAGGPYRSAPSLSGGAAASDRAFAVESRAAERRIALTRSTTRAIERELHREERVRIASMERQNAANRRHMQAVANRRQHARSQFMSDPIGSMPSLVRGVGGAIVGGAGSLIGHGLDAAGSLVRGSFATQSIANRVSISARKAGQEFTDPNELRKQFESTAIATPGLKAEEVGEAAAKYLELTGDIKTARASLTDFATVASATNTKIGDVATAAAAIGEKFNVKGPEEMRNVLAALAFQGKEGAIELKDVATQFQRLAAAGAAFGIEKSPAGVAKLGGLLQVARQGTGNARSAATAVENVFAGLTAKGSKIPGLKIYNKDGSKRDINETLADAVSMAGGSNMAAKEASLLKVFGRQGLRAVNPLMSVYRDASAGKTGKEAQDAGRAAILKTLQDMSQAGASWAEIQKDAAQAQMDTSARLTGAWEQLKAAAGERLAPAVADLATRIAGNQKVLDMFAAALGAAGTGLELFAAFLTKMGLIDGGTPAEQQAAAMKKVGRYEAQMQGLDPNSKEYAVAQTKRNLAIEEVAAAKRAAAVEKTSPSAMAGKLDLFEQRYAAAAGDSTVGKAQAFSEGRSIAEALARDPNDWSASSDVMNFGETKEQTAERHRFMNREGAYAPEGGANAGDTSTKAIIAEAMAAMKGAAAEQKAASAELKSAAGALNKRPTITGGTN